MSTTIEQRIRSELDREHDLIEALRRDPALLAPEAREHHAETLAELESAWERARDAVDAVASAVGREASLYSAEFGDAWRLLKSRMRGVLAH
jgi:hypothetical protein